MTTITSTAINAQSVSDLLKSVHGASFAQVEYTSDVPVAAKFKNAVKIRKHTSANIQVFNHLKEFTEVYANAVKRSASKIGGNDADAVKEFTTGSSYFDHTDCFSIVKHKTADKYYLYAIFNNATSEYEIDGQIVSKDEVVQYLTPSEAKKFASDGIVHNVTNGIDHGVIVRTISLDNVKRMKAQGQIIGG